jgi:hypothetical protein
MLLGLFYINDIATCMQYIQEQTLCTMDVEMVHAAC